MTSKSKSVLGFVVCLLLLAGVLLYPRVQQYMAKHSQYPAAIYTGFEFRGIADRFDLFVSSGQDGSVAHVHVELPDGSVYALDELPEKVVAQFLTDHFTGENQTSYSDLPGAPAGMQSSIYYSNGKPVAAHIHAVSKGFRIAPKVDGPFVRLPIDRETLLKTFGEPLEWRKYRPRAPSFGL